MKKGSSRVLNARGRKLQESLQSSWQKHQKRVDFFLPLELHYLTTDLPREMFTL